MINLLPPSPAPSQIDTTFIRRERTDVAKERSPHDCYCSRKAEHVRRPEDAGDVEDDDPDEDHSVEAAETTEFDTLLSLVVQPRAHKKQVDTDIVSEARTPDESIDADSTLILIDVTQWTLLAKSKDIATADTSSSIDETIQGLGNAQISTATPLTEDIIKLTLTGSDDSASIVTPKSMQAGRLPTDIAVDNFNNDTVQKLETTAAPEVAERQELTSIHIQTGSDEVLEVPVEIVARTLKSPVVSMEPASIQPTTDFKTNYDPGFSTDALVPESDEITREIERLISARPGQTLPRLASPEIRTPRETLSVSAAFLGAASAVDEATQVADALNLQRSSDASVAATENNQISTLARQARSENQSSYQQSDDGGTQHQRASASPNAVSAAGWSGSSNVSSEFVMTTRGEFQEPLSSQAARAIVQHFEARETNDNESLTVRLDPPELGELTIELSRTRDGLAVRVTAREAVTMEMLLSRGHEIEQHLKNQNVDVATMEFLSSGMMNQQSSRQEGSRHSNNDIFIESARRQSKSSLQSAADARSDATTARDSSRPLSFRA